MAEMKFQLTGIDVEKLGEYLRENGIENVEDGGKHVRKLSNEDTMDLLKLLWDDGDAELVNKRIKLTKNENTQLTAILQGDDEEEEDDEDDEEEEDEEDEDDEEEEEDEEDEDDEEEEDEELEEEEEE